MMKKAARLREETGNPSIFAAHERERGAPGHLWKVSLLRPFRFLFTEPVRRRNLSLQRSIQYADASSPPADYLPLCSHQWIDVRNHFLGKRGFPSGSSPSLLRLNRRRDKTSLTPPPFLFFQVFGAGNGGHGWTHIGTINLTYLSFVLGAFMFVSFFHLWIPCTRRLTLTLSSPFSSGFALQPLQERFYHKKVAEAKGQSNPEARWGSSRWATPFLAVGLFIAAWTSYPHITFIAPLVGFTLFGIAFFIIITAILVSFHPLVAFLLLPLLSDWLLTLVAFL